MKTRYKIVITEWCQEVKTVGGTWELGAGDTPNDYGHSPQIEKTCEVSRSVYSQNVDELDVVAVISAVNNMNSTVMISGAEYSGQIGTEGI